MIKIYYRTCCGLWTGAVSRGHGATKGSWGGVSTGRVLVGGALAFLDNMRGFCAGAVACTCGAARVDIFLLSCVCLCVRVCTCVHV